MISRLGSTGPIDAVSGMPMTAAAIVPTTDNPMELMVFNAADISLSRSLLQIAEDDGVQTFL